MADEQVMTGSAGLAQRQRRQRAGLAAAARAAAEKPDLDERERKISPKRKAMGPTVPPEDQRLGLSGAQPSVSDEPPTDPK